MNIRVARNVVALGVYILICALTLTLIALVTELIFIPFLAWLHGYPTYYLPTLTRAFAWGKFIVFASIIGGGGAWFVDRKRFNR